MNDALEFGLKSFFAGCLGCLGACCLLAVVVFGGTLVFKPQLEKLGQGLTGTMTQALQAGPAAEPGHSSDSAPSPGQPQEGPRDGPAQHIIYLTKGEDPQGDWVHSFPRAQADNVYLWVANPPEDTRNFVVMVTLPDGQQVQFGPEFTPQPSGEPLKCGHLSSENLPSGQFRAGVYPPGGEEPLAETQFFVEE
jgi:hypothetical protein